MSKFVAAKKNPPSKRNSSTSQFKWAKSPTRKFSQFDVDVSSFKSIVSPSVSDEEESSDSFEPV
jgi:hypothetical protein